MMLKMWLTNKQKLHFLDNSTLRDKSGQFYESPIPQDNSSETHLTKVSHKGSKGIVVGMNTILSFG